MYAFVNNSTADLFDKDGRLSVKRISDESRTCDQVLYKYWFTLDQPASCDGYIVQENRIYQEKEPCSRPPFVPPPDILVNHIWEAFSVKQGETTHDSGGFTDGVRFSGVKDSSGGLIVHGSIKFFCKDKTGDLGAKADDPNDPTWGRFEETGGLPSTKRRPSWWDAPADEGPAFRIVEADWDCCTGCARSPSWNVTSSP